MKKLFVVFSILLLPAPLFALTGEGQARFDRANQAYREGHFKEARQNYETLVQNEPENPSLLYNLANAYYREGNKGMAILYYERALLHAPRNQDIRNNLKFVRGLLEYRMEDKRDWYLKFGETIFEYFREEELTLLALLGYFVFVSGLVFVIIFRPGLPWGPVRKTLLIFCMAFAGLAAAKKIQVHHFQDAIVLSREAEVRYGPSESDQVAFRLGEGLKIYSVEGRENWSRILVPNGQSGWIKNSDISPVLPPKGSG